MRKGKSEMFLRHGAQRAPVENNFIRNRTKNVAVSGNFDMAPARPTTGPAEPLNARACAKDA